VRSDPKRGIDRTNPNQSAPLGNALNLCRHIFVGF